MKDWSHAQTFHVIFLALLEIMLIRNWPKCNIVDPLCTTEAQPLGSLKTKSSMSPVKLRWKSVILTALVLTEALLALCYPFISVTPESKTRTRRLMAEVGAGNYGEERVRQLQEQLYISKNSHDSQVSVL